MFSFPAVDRVLGPLVILLSSVTECQRLHCTVCLSTESATCVHDCWNPLQGRCENQTVGIIVMVCLRVKTFCVLFVVEHTHMGNAKHEQHLLIVLHQFCQLLVCHSGHIMHVVQQWIVEYLFWLVLADPGAVAFSLILKTKFTRRATPPPPGDMSRNKAVPPLFEPARVVHNLRN